VTTAASDRPTRVAADLLDSAAIEGARQSRSAKQQLDHWARVGRAVSMKQTAARRRVEAALSGALAERELSPEERMVFNAELDTAISETARRVRFGEVLSARGVTTVALDADGVLTRHNPDGTSSTLT
jgi:ParD-like antitoxin of type II bacterial toxin-antitoxin system